MNSSTASLPHVLSGQRHELHDAQAGRISYYVDGPPAGHADDSNQPAPLLLIHSINAAPSAHEVKPIYDIYKRRRRTYAIDLPGFGHSERSDRRYDQALMVRAVQAMAEHICQDHDGHAIDALSVSLAGEFLAKVAKQQPEKIRSLALVSPTGFAKITKTHGPPEADLGKIGVYRFISRPLVGTNIYKLLTSRPSIRFFLKKTFGRTTIDEEMFAHACRLSRTPDAHRAPLHFIAGYLFSADIRSVFRQIQQPVWLCHGLRGDFNDYSRTAGIADQPNWRTNVFQTGAMPYFEDLDAFVAAYDEFLASLDAAPSNKSLEQG
ncbi:MAG: alpha/beta fold hydrolase [Wenzhouxiangella sp.]